MGVAIKYEGVRDSAGYKIHFHEGPDGFDRDGEPTFPARTSEFAIAAEGGTSVGVLIDGLDDLLFSKIAELDPLDYFGVCTFIDEYGFLAPPVKDKLEAEVISQGISWLRATLEAAQQKDWRLFEREMTTLLNKRWGETAPTRTTEVRRVPGMDRPPQIFEVARDLFTFAALQLAVAVSGGADIRKCPQCQNLFAVGPIVNRKRDARFCSDRCRVANHRTAGI